jgi:TPP-dependent pyruvate/acetoin dehydrogenase alpha subunit
MAVDTGTQSPPETPAAAPRLDRDSVLADYRIGWISREASLLGRREVLTGKAKFGIFGDGKEVAQLAMAKACRPGDWRSGYYRDQTLMMALGLLTVDQLFAQLYAHTDVAADPASAGRQMNAHFATRLVDDEGRFRDQLAGFNVSADLSPTGSQMPRLVGLAYASRLYRELPELAAPDFARFSAGGDEIAFGTIGNASTAEGMFWEAINAVGVLRSPLLMSIWDDGYGISVGNEHQVCKQDLSELLWGFQRRRDSRDGYDLHTVRGWDYPALVECYVQAAEVVRREHVPAIVHVVELTQPQGHSTSGSHERYKSAERLAWEEEWDCLKQMRRWLLAEGLAEEGALDEIEQAARSEVREAQRRAWEAYREPLDEERRHVAGLLGAVADAAPDEEVAAAAGEARRALERKGAAFRRDLVAAARDVLVAAHEEEGPALDELAQWEAAARAEGAETYGRHLHAEGARSALAVEPVAAAYDDDAPTLNGFEILNRAFDAAFARTPNLIAFGEDVGQLGDVNQGMAGLQAKYGPLRVSDTGIRETTILGQAIGMAMRGLQAHRRDPVPRLPALRAADRLGRPRQPALEERRRPEGAGDHPHAGPPAGGDLALRLADGRHPRPGARRLGVRAARHDAGGRLLQHAARRRRPGPGRRGAQRLPRQGAPAVEPRRLPPAARRARGAAGRPRRDAGHLRRLLPHRRRGRRAARPGGRRGRDRRRPDAAPLRPLRAHRRVGEEDRPRRLPRRGRPRRRHRLHAAAGDRGGRRLLVARLAAGDGHRPPPPPRLRLRRRLLLEARPRGRLRRRLRPDARGVAAALPALHPVALRRSTLRAGPSSPRFSRRCR